MDIFNTNFKLLLQYIGRVASMEKDCPMNTTMMDAIIGYIFGDVERSSRLMSHFQENRMKIDSIMRGSSSSFVMALKNRDRAIFKHMELFPSSLKQKYGLQITWFSNFLENRMRPEHAQYVWLYLDALDRGS